MCWTTTMKQHTISRIERVIGTPQDEKYGHKESLARPSTIRAIERRLGVEYPDSRPYNKTSDLEYVPGTGYVRRGIVVVPDTRPVVKGRKVPPSVDAVIDPSLHRTVRAVCAVMNVDTDAFYSKSRKAPLPLARQIVSYIIMERTNDYKAAMGALATHDHSSVCYNVGKIKNDLAVGNAKTSGIVDRVNNLLDTPPASSYIVGVQWGQP